MNSYPYFQPQPSWVPSVAITTLVVALYLVKSAVVRRSSGVREAVGWFAPVVLLMVPVTWAVSDWKNIHLYPVMHWIGTPVAVLTVPTVSFFFDLVYLADRGRVRPAGWYLPELILGWPLWVVFWAFFSFYILGWGWI